DEAEAAVEVRNKETATTQINMKPQEIKEKGTLVVHLTNADLVALEGTFHFPNIAGFQPSPVPKTGLMMKLPAGKYDITVGATGFVDESYTIDVEPNTKTVLNYKLREKDRTPVVE